MVEGKPKVAKPMNAFLLYRKFIKDKIVKEHNVTKSHEISKIAGTLWANEDVETREKFQKQSQELFTQHLIDNPGYSFSPKKQRVVKKKVKVTPQIGKYDYLPQGCLPEARINFSVASGCFENTKTTPKTSNLRYSTIGSLYGDPIPFSESFEANHTTMNHQFPAQYPYLNYHRAELSQYVNSPQPYRSELPFAYGVLTESYWSNIQQPSEDIKNIGL
ncbi:hypothetical protein BC833DRAFT_562007 [Globomyces pollinis-pini]|nr:hypothetical protein BC833DRAFT_562007 [Globomyces pollinis-pini]